MLTCLEFLSQKVDIALSKSGQTGCIISLPLHPLQESVRVLCNTTLNRDPPMVGAILKLNASFVSDVAVSTSDVATCATFVVPGLIVLNITCQILFPATKTVVNLSTSSPLRGQVILAVQHEMFCLVVTTEQGFEAACCSILTTFCTSTEVDLDFTNSSYVHLAVEFAPKTNHACFAAAVTTVVPSDSYRTRLRALCMNPLTSRRT